MPVDWIDSTIGEQATLQRGIDITRVEQREGVVPVISSGGVSSYHDTAAVKGPGVILGRKGVVGSVYFVEADYWPHDTTLWVKDFHGNNPRFVYYFFKYHAPLLASMDVGSANPTLNRNHVHPISIRWPNRSIQNCIAHILGTLDDKIELIRRMNETLEGMARAIFKSWFVDFDPVRAKADGRHPPGLDPATAALFPDSFEDSPLGKIPKGWKAGTISDLADLNSWTLSTSDKLDRIDYIEISEVMRGAIGSIVTYERGHEPSRARRRLRHGDTVLSTVRPDRGAYFLCIEPSPSLVASTGFAVLTPRTIPWSFVYLIAARQEMLDELGRLADGGAYPAVRPEVIAALDAVVPAPSAVLDAFHAICEPMLLRVDLHRRQQLSLAAIRDSLLPKLLSGEIRVSEAETIAEAVTSQ